MPLSTGTGAASKAATIWNWAMKSWVWQVEVVAELEPPSAAPPRAEDCTPTRVTPSMSFSAWTKPATASWLRAQPTSSSAGPAIESRRETLAAPSGATSGLAVPVRLVSQTSPGRTRASSRITRSQSKRLSARLATVASRCSPTLWNWV